MLVEIKKRCGYAPNVTVYDEEILGLINSAIADLSAAGVIKEVLQSGIKQVLNAITCYVKAYRGNDRTDTEKYLKMYSDLRLYLELLTAEDIPILQGLEVTE